MQINRNGNSGSNIPTGAQELVLDNKWDLGLQNQPNGATDDKPTYKHAYCFHCLDENDRVCRISATITNNMGEKSKFQELVRALLGRSLTPAEIKAGQIDDSVLVGKSCLGNIVSKVVNGRTRTSIQNYTPLPRGMAPLTHVPEATPPKWVVDAQALRLDDPEPQVQPARVPQSQNVIVETESGNLWPESE